jgi:hypothetical protein
MAAGFKFGFLAVRQRNKDTCLEGGLVRLSGIVAGQVPPLNDNHESKTSRISR